MTRPDSIVGIVAVDKSVNLMNVSNDITMENVSLAIFSLQKYTLKENNKKRNFTMLLPILKEISFFKYKSVIVKLLNERDLHSSCHAGKSPLWSTVFAVLHENCHLEFPLIFKLYFN